MPIKMDFGRPNVEIAWKMANGRLLFLVLPLLKIYSKFVYQIQSNTEMDQKMTCNTPLF